MTRRNRIIVVTLALLALGAVTGGAAGAAVGALAALLPDHPGGRLHPGFMSVGASFGALMGAQMGAVLLPVAGWLLMRRVAIGRVLLGTSLGTILGGVVGWFAPVGSDDIGRSLLAALVGFAAAVYLLRRSAPTGPAAPPVE